MHYIRDEDEITLKINTSIARKLVFQAVVVSLVTIIISMLFTYESAKEIIIQKTSNQLLSEAAIRGTSIENILNSRATHAHILADKPEIQKMVQDLNDVHSMSNRQDRNDEEFLLHIAEFERLVGNAEIDNIIIADGMGNILFSLDRRMPISDVSETTILPKGNEC